MKNLENILSHSDCLSQEQMQLYLDNKLDQEQTHAVERHITDCMLCSDAIEGLLSIDAVLVEEHVADIKSHIEDLINDQDDKTPVTTKKEVVPLQVKKSGKRSISWRAAAGLFLLIFGGGLVVFSYIKQNTNWFPNQEEHYSKNDQPASKGLSEGEDLKVATPELESISIEGSDLPTDLNSGTPRPPTKKDVVNTDQREVKKPSSVVSKNEELVAKNNTIEERADISPAPIKTIPRQKEASKPSSTIAATNTTAKNADVGKEKSKTAEKQVIAKVDNKYQIEDNLATQNTYSQPRYEGRLKDVKQIGGLENEKDKRKQAATQQVDIAGGRSDETVYMIDGIQNKGLKKGADYGNLDNFTKGNNAYNKGDYKQSIRYYKRALRKKDVKNRDEILYQLAMAYERTNNQSKAETIYEELEKKAPFKSRALNGLERVRSRKISR